MNNELVLEQYLSPVSPLLAGFRLDAFSAIKPRVTHSPSSKAHMRDTSATLLEDRHISPAVLYIQVSALQVLKRTDLLSSLFAFTLIFDYECCKVIWHKVVEFFTFSKTHL